MEKENGTGLWLPQAAFPGTGGLQVHNAYASWVFPGVPLHTCGWWGLRSPAWPLHPWDGDPDRSRRGSLHTPGSGVTDSSIQVPPHAPPKRPPSRNRGETEVRVQAADSGVLTVGSHLGPLRDLRWWTHACGQCGSILTLPLGFWPAVSPLCPRRPMTQHMACAHPRDMSHAASHGHI